tara:strand:+ start:2398 stop:4374 length:1977 start_codon:yes stop_codon:yes gene_type:complete
MRYFQLFIFSAVLAQTTKIPFFDLDFWNYNTGITMNFGDSYDDYSFMENRMDLNFFKGNFSGWLQYEYSDPPELGFPIKDLRKYRFEYNYGPWRFKYGDIYEVWGRGLTLVQIDDQSIDFDNSTRGVMINYETGRVRISHLNGTTKNDILDTDLRVPAYTFTHEMEGTNLEFDFEKYSVGLSYLQSDEFHQHRPFGPLDTAFVNHRLSGFYLTSYGKYSDLFFEYVDKQSKESIFSMDFFGNEVESVLPLKKGYGLYLNSNFYFNSLSIFAEYKRYSFDRINPTSTDYVITNYGNRIDYQVMPILYREQNHSFLGRVAHQTNANDERGIQVEISSALPWNLQMVTQFSKLSRNDTWQSLSPINWEPKKVKGFLPSDEISTLPYTEIYNEISGYFFQEKLFAKVVFGANKEIPKMIRNIESYNTNIRENWVYTDSIEFNDDWYYTDSIFMGLDTSSYDVVSKLYRKSKTFTIPIELNYKLNNEYSLGFGLAYQEKTLKNISNSNVGSYNWLDSSWVLLDPDNASYFEKEITNQYPNNISTQINRMFSLSLSKASHWALTVSYDWTNVQEVIELDPQYTPLEAFLFGDLKYFKGQRDRFKPPSFIQNKWVSMELSYNITSTQRISIIYGSLQGGLICSNGICRILQPFNDGLKLSYSAVL